jgi:hypothetical protein
MLVINILTPVIAGGAVGALGAKIASTTAERSFIFRRVAASAINRTPMSCFNLDAYYRRAVIAACNDEKFAC